MIIRKLWNYIKGKIKKETPNFQAVNINTRLFIMIKCKIACKKEVKCYLIVIVSVKVL